jgi:hypothetical protein
MCTSRVCPVAPACLLPPVIRTTSVFSQHILPGALSQGYIAVVYKAPNRADPDLGPIVEEAILTTDVFVPAAEREHRSHGRIAS